MAALSYRRILPTLIVVSMLLFLKVQCSELNEISMNKGLVNSTEGHENKITSPLSTKTSLAQDTIERGQTLMRQDLYTLTKQSTESYAKSSLKNESASSKKRFSRQGLSYSRRLSEVRGFQKKRSRDAIVSRTDVLHFISRSERLLDAQDSTTRARVEQSPEQGHGDLFSCPPCNCSHTHSRLIKADCKFVGLNKLPQTLPVDVWAIDMSQNELWTFDTSSVLKYPGLTSLDLSRNHLRSVHGHMKGNATSNIQELVLNHNCINYIERSSLCVMNKLVTLEIGYNKLTRIEHASLRCLEKLRQLDLSFNEIKLIDDAAFDSLHTLLSLFLQGNKKLGYYPKRFSPRIVQNLRNLRTLWIQGNSDGSSMYPNDLLGNLSNLKNLSIDGMRSGIEFGPQLRKLRNLKTLSFGPKANCYLQNVSSTFFQYTIHLESLTFIECSLFHIDPKAFKALPNLEEYTLKFINSNEYNLDRAFQDLQPFNSQNSSLRSLTFMHVHHSSIPCVVLSSKQGEYIKNMRLESLNLDKNRIALIRDDFLVNIPRTLQSLSLRRNKCMISGNIATRISFLTNLQEIDLSEQNIDIRFHSFMEEYESEFVKQQDVTEEYDHEGDKDELFHDACLSSQYLLSSPAATHIIRPDVSQDRKDLSLSSHVESRSRSMRCAKFLKKIRKRVLDLPPNLHIIRASKYLFFATLFLFKQISDNNLTYLNFSSSFQSDWGRGHLPRKVEVVDLSNNQCPYLTANFFHPNNYLTALHFQGNLLGKTFSEDDNGLLMRYLNKLYFLDISVNMIFRLPSQFFKGLINLKTLKMQDNKLRTLGVRFSHLEHLNFIDASKNSISWISKETRDDLDFLANKSAGNIIMDLTYNPLPCTCGGLNILHWMNNSKVYFTNKDFLWCFYSNGSRGSLSDIHSVIKTLASDCASDSTYYKYLLIAVVSGLSGLIFAFLFCTFIYRQRWRILYSFNNGFLVKIFGFRPSGNYDNTNFKFDAYIVYAEEDRNFVLNDLLEEMEEKRGHKICVEDRDFIPGTYNFNNINCAVQNSTVTLLVISENFIRENEFGYAVQMALLEEYLSQNKREVCHLLLYDEFATSELPKDLQVLMMKNRFIEFPKRDENETNSDDRIKFWDRLSLFIGHTTCAGTGDTGPDTGSETTNLFLSG